MSKTHSITQSDFHADVLQLTSKFNWRAKHFEREGEWVVVALTEADETFERFVWIYDVDRVMLRCLLVVEGKVPPDRRDAIIELCARINEGLPFGCLEYSLSESVLVFRDTADLTWGHLKEVVGDTSARVLNLGKKYAPAIAATLKGGAPEQAVIASERS